MKKILLASINARYTHSCLALYCLKSALRDLDVSTVIMEFSINQKPGEIIGQLVMEGADIIALSVYIWNAEMIKKLMPELHNRCGGSLIVLGGPEVSYNPVSWLNTFPCIDYIVTGGGEEGFRSLVQKEFRSDEKIIAVPNPPFAEMPAPYTVEDLAGLRNRYIYYESGRGCPFQCTYCLSSRSDQKIDLKRLDTVKSELDFILRSGPELVKFVDRTFNADRARSRAIWQYLLDNHASGPTTFHFEIHPLYLGDEDFDLLSACPEGLFRFEIGVQSTNTATLSAVKRNGDWTRERAALSRLIAIGTIHIHLDLIAGLPFDDMVSIARSFSETYDLGPDHLQMGFLKILPGTEMMETAAGHGMVYSPRAPYRIMENRWLTGQDLRLLDGIAHLVDRLYNTGRFNTTLALLAGRHESPFFLFRDLASRYEANTRQVTRSWESGARFIAEYVSLRFSEEKNFFLDAIRWDWCAVSRSPYYPDLIKPAGYPNIKKKSISYFMDRAEQGKINHDGIRFGLPELKKSIFFQATSVEFRQRQMKGNSYALFLPDKKFIMYDV